MALQKQKQNHHNNHQPVLLPQVIELLDPKIGESYLDLTVGFGGHAKAVLARTKAPNEAFLVDRDKSALSYTSKMLAKGAELLHADFFSAINQLKGRSFNMILMDLGVSSAHLDRAERGFSFKSTGPLDMRMDQSQQLSAHEVVNDWSETRIAELIYQYGEEPRAKQIAQEIVKARPIESTTELAELVASNTRYKKFRKHPATKTFQAIRIAVNDELNQLRESLPLLPDLLKEDGRLVIISFHSLEDRIVKQYFNEESRSGYEARLKLLTKKPIKGETEDVHNLRARSARLRAVVKINKNKNERSA